MSRRFIVIAAAICVIVSLRLSDPPRVLDEVDVVRAVVVGDSVAHGAGDEARLGIPGRLDRELRARHIAFKPTVNLGINGARTYNVVHLLRGAYARSAVMAANVVIVSIGGNDLYGDPFARITTLLSPQWAIHQVVNRVRGVIAEIHRINPAARIVLLGLYNPYRRAAFLDRAVNLWDARLIATFASDAAVTVERIADLMRSQDRLSAIDHFHPSATGYALIAARIVPAID